MTNLCIDYGNNSDISFRVKRRGDINAPTINYGVHSKFILNIATVVGNAWALTKLTGRQATSDVIPGKATITHLNFRVMCVRDAPLLNQLTYVPTNLALR